MNARKLINGLYKVNGFLAALSLFTLLLIVILQMISRWAGSSIPGLTTYAGYIMGSLSFFGLSYAFFHQSHIRVNLLLDHFGRYRKAAEIWSSGLTAIIAILLSYYTIKMVYVSYAIHEISQAQDASYIWIVQLPMAFGMVSLAIATLDIFIKNFSTKNEDFTSSTTAH